MHWDIKDTSLRTHELFEIVCTSIMCSSADVRSGCLQVEDVVVADSMADAAVAEVVAVEAAEDLGLAEA